jgi:hypothetical protein
VGPGARPAITAPAGAAALPRGSVVTIAWTALPGVTRYAIGVIGFTATGLPLDRASDARTLVIP